MMRKLLIFMLVCLVMVGSASAIQVHEADFNKDSKVDLQDISALISDYGKTDDYNYRHDVNRDWKINLYDLIAVARSYGIYQGQTHTYDVVVVGAGSGGIAAAIQAARLGASVALLEETDYIGGQIIAVPTMDEVKEVDRGFGMYSEFINKVISHYNALGKSMGTCYASDLTRCMEPSVARQELMEMIGSEDIDLFLRTKVYNVLKSGNTVTGVIAENGDRFNSEIVIDATEYGDIIPLTGAEYRIGNSISGNINPDSCIQDITYTAIMKMYPGGVPQGLFMENPPSPDYEKASQHFETVISKTGGSTWTSGDGYPFDWVSHNAYRGVPDSSNPQDYTATPRSEAQKITKTGVNWANDYPWSARFVEGTSSTLKVRYIEDYDYRRRVNCEAKLKTLQFIYYAQHDLEQPGWSIANDEGFDTPYNIEENLCPNIPAEYKEIEKHFPPIPYVRESRRIVPVDTLTAGEIQRLKSGARAPVSFKTALALGAYPNDLHHCKMPDTLEMSLDSETLDIIMDEEGKVASIHWWLWGPFQVPFESFIPETIDGFLPAEKNIGVTRLVSGATRLQPITLLTGQAAGAIAALSVQENVQPRNLNPVLVQKELLDAASQISLYYDFDDVPKTHPYWKHVQMVSTHGIMVGSETSFSVDDLLTRAQMAAALANLLELPRDNPPASPTFEDVVPESWAYKHVEAIYDAGITGGCSADPPLFCPDNKVARAEMATFILKALDESPYDGPEQSFTDVPVGRWDHKWVEKVTQLGIMSGYGDGTFRPEQEMKRGEVAAALYNSLLNMNDIS